MNPIFALYDPRDLRDFAIAGTEILPDEFSILDLSSSFHAVASSMEMMNVLANQILLGTGIAILVVVNLLIMLFLGSRRHEIGIYLALGERRITIIGQMVLEVAIVVLFSMILALFVGQFLSGILSRTMLQNDIVNINNSMADERVSFASEFVPVFTTPEQSPELSWFYGGQMTADEFLEQYDVSLTPEFIILFSGMGSLVVLLSTIFPIAYIVRLNPKKVLM